MFSCMGTNIVSMKVLDIYYTCMGRVFRKILYIYIMDSCVDICIHTYRRKGEIFAFVIGMFCGFLFIKLYNIHAGHVVKGEIGEFCSGIFLGFRWAYSVQINTIVVHNGCVVWLESSKMVDLVRVGFVGRVCLLGHGCCA